MSYDPESGGSQANRYEIRDLPTIVFIAGLFSFLSMVWNFVSLVYMAPLIYRPANTWFNSGMGTRARGDMLRKIDNGLAPQTNELADISLDIVTGGLTAATYTEIVGAEQGDRPPRDGNNPPLPKTEVEDAQPYFEHVLLLIKQRRHRMKFFAANIQGKWTDRDTFSKIKDHYHRYKSSWWYLNTLSHVEFKKVGVLKFISHNYC